MEVLPVIARNKMTRYELFTDNPANDQGVYHGTHEEVVDND